VKEIQKKAGSSKERMRRWKEKKSPLWGL